MQSAAAEDRPNIGLTVIVLKTSDQKSRLMRVVAPLGVLLPSGLGLKIDNQDVGRAGFVRCLPSGCVAEVVMDDNLTKQLRNGQTSTFIIFRTSGGRNRLPDEPERFWRGLRPAAVIFVAPRPPAAALPKPFTNPPAQRAANREDVMRAAGFVSAIAAIVLTEFLAEFLAGATSPRFALAQNDYPNRPVSLLTVPYAAGGVADVAMRMLGDKLSTRLGQQFVIENRPGAGGIVAAQTAAAAPGTAIRC